MQRLQQQVISWVVGSVADVADVTPADVSTQLLSGAASMSNVRMRLRKINSFIPNAFPLEVVGGKIGRLSFSVPWLTIAAQPILVEVAGVRLTLSGKSAAAGSSGDGGGGNSNPDGSNAVNGRLGFATDAVPALAEAELAALRAAIRAGLAPDVFFANAVAEEDDDNDDDGGEAMCAEDDDDDIEDVSDDSGTDNDTVEGNDAADVGGVIANGNGNHQRGNGANNGSFQSGDSPQAQPQTSKLDCSIPSDTDADSADWKSCNSDDENDSGATATAGSGPTTGLSISGSVAAAPAKGGFTSRLWAGLSAAASYVVPPAWKAPRRVDIVLSDIAAVLMCAEYHCEFTIHSVTVTAAPRELGCSSSDSSDGCDDSGNSSASRKTVRVQGVSLSLCVGNRECFVLIPDFSCEATVTDSDAPASTSSAGGSNSNNNSSATPPSRVIEAVISALRVSLTEAAAVHVARFVQTLRATVVGVPPAWRPLQLLRYRRRWWAFATQSVLLSVQLRRSRWNLRRSYIAFVGSTRRQYAHEVRALMLAAATAATTDDGGGNGGETAASWAAELLQQATTRLIRLESHLRHRDVVAAVRDAVRRDLGLPPGVALPKTAAAAAAAAATTVEPTAESSADPARATRETSTLLRVSVVAATMELPLGLTGTLRGVGVRVAIEPPGAHASASASSTTNPGISRGVGSGDTTRWSLNVASCTLASETHGGAIFGDADDGKDNGDLSERTPVASAPFISANGQTIREYLFGTLASSSTALVAARVARAGAGAASVGALLRLSGGLLFRFLSPAAAAAAASAGGVAAATASHPTTPSSTRVGSTPRLGAPTSVSVPRFSVPNTPLGQSLPKSPLYPGVASASIPMIEAIGVRERRIGVVSVQSRAVRVPRSLLVALCAFATRLVSAIVELPSPNPAFAASTPGISRTEATTASGESVTEVHDVVGVDAASTAASRRIVVRLPDCWEVTMVLAGLSVHVDGALRMMMEGAALSLGTAFGSCSARVSCHSSTASSLGSQVSLSTAANYSNGASPCTPTPTAARGALRMIVVALTPSLHVTRVEVRGASVALLVARSPADGVEEPTLGNSSRVVVPLVERFHVATVASAASPVALSFAAGGGGGTATSVETTVPSSWASGTPLLCLAVTPALVVRLQPSEMIPWGANFVAALQAAAVPLMKVLESLAGRTTPLPPPAVIVPPATPISAFTVASQRQAGPNSRSSFYEDFKTAGLSPPQRANASQADESNFDDTDSVVAPSETPSRASTRRTNSRLACGGGGSAGVDSRLMFRLVLPPDVTVFLTATTHTTIRHGLIDLSRAPVPAVATTAASLSRRTHRQQRTHTLGVAWEGLCLSCGGGVFEVVAGVSRQRTAESEKPSAPPVVPSVGSLADLSLDFSCLSMSNAAAGAAKSTNSLDQAPPLFAGMSIERAAAFVQRQHVGATRVCDLVVTRLGGVPPPHVRISLPTLEIRCPAGPARHPPLATASQVTLEAAGREVHLGIGRVALAHDAAVAALQIDIAPLPRVVIPDGPYVGSALRLTVTLSRLSAIDLPKTDFGPLIALMASHVVPWLQRNVPEEATRTYFFNALTEVDAFVVTQQLPTLAPAAAAAAAVASATVDDAPETAAAAPFAVLVLANGRRTYFQLRGLLPASEASGSRNATSPVSRTNSVSTSPTRAFRRADTAAPFEETMMRDKGGVEDEATRKAILVENVMNEFAPNVAAFVLPPPLSFQRRQRSGAAVAVRNRIDTLRLVIAASPVEVIWWLSCPEAPPSSASSSTSVPAPAAFWVRLGPALVERVLPLQPYWTRLDAALVAAVTRRQDLAVHLGSLQAGVDAPLLTQATTNGAHTATLVDVACVSVRSDNLPPVEAQRSFEGRNVAPATNTTEAPAATGAPLPSITVCVDCARVGLQSSGGLTGVIAVAVAVRQAIRAVTEPMTRVVSSDVTPVAVAGGNDRSRGAMSLFACAVRDAGSDESDAPAHLPVDATPSECGASRVRFCAPQHLAEGASGARGTHAIRVHGATVDFTDDPRTRTILVEGAVAVFFSETTFLLPWSSIPLEMFLTNGERDGCIFWVPLWEGEQALRRSGFVVATVPSLSSFVLAPDCRIGFVRSQPAAAPDSARSEVVGDDDLLPATARPATLGKLSTCEDDDGGVLRSPTGCLFSDDGLLPPSFPALAMRAVAMHVRQLAVVVDVPSSSREGTANESAVVEAACTDVRLSLVRDDGSSSTTRTARGEHSPHKPFTAAPNVPGVVRGEIAVPAVRIILLGTREGGEHLAPTTSVLLLRKGSFVAAAKCTFGPDPRGLRSRVLRSKASATTTTPSGIAQRVCIRTSEVSVEMAADGRGGALLLPLPLICRASDAIQAVVAAAAISNPSSPPASTPKTPGSGDSSVANLHVEGGPVLVPLLGVASVPTSAAMTPTPRESPGNALWRALVMWRVVPVTLTVRCEPCALEVAAAIGAPLLRLNCHGCSVSVVAGPPSVAVVLGTATSSSFCAGATTAADSDRAASTSSAQSFPRHSDTLDAAEFSVLRQRVLSTAASDGGGATPTATTGGAAAPIQTADPATAAVSVSSSWSIDRYSGPHIAWRPLLRRCTTSGKASVLVVRRADSFASFEGHVEGAIGVGPIHVDADEGTAKALPLLVAAAASRSQLLAQLPRLRGGDRVANGGVSSLQASLTLRDETGLGFALHTSTGLLFACLPPDEDHAAAASSDEHQHRHDSRDPQAWQQQLQQRLAPAATIAELCASMLPDDGAGTTVVFPLAAHDALVGPLCVSLASRDGARHALHFHGPSTPAFAGGTCGNEGEGSGNSEFKPFLGLSSRSAIIHVDSGALGVAVEHACDRLGNVRVVCRSLFSISCNGLGVNGRAGGVAVVAGWPRVPVCVAVALSDCGPAALPIEALDTPRLALLLIDHRLARDAQNASAASDYSVASAALVVTAWLRSAVRQARTVSRSPSSRATTATSPTTHSPTQATAASYHRAPETMDAAVSTVIPCFVLPATPRALAQRAATTASKALYTGDGGLAGVWRRAAGTTGGADSEDSSGNGGESTSTSDSDEDRGLASRRRGRRRQRGQTNLDGTRTVEFVPSRVGGGDGDSDDDNEGVIVSPPAEESENSSSQDARGGFRGRSVALLPKLSVNLPTAAATLSLAPLLRVVNSTGMPMSVTVLQESVPAPTKGGAQRRRRKSSADVSNPGIDRNDASSRLAVLEAAVRLPSGASLAVFPLPRCRAVRVHATLDCCSASPGVATVSTTRTNTSSSTPGHDNQLDGSVVVYSVDQVAIPLTSRATLANAAGTTLGMRISTGAGTPTALVYLSLDGWARVTNRSGTALQFSRADGNPIAGVGTTAIPPYVDVTASVGALSSLSALPQNAHSNTESPLFLLPTGVELVVRSQATEWSDPFILVSPTPISGAVATSVDWRARLEEARRKESAKTADIVVNAPLLGEDDSAPLPESPSVAARGSSLLPPRWCRRQSSVTIRCVAVAVSTACNEGNATDVAVTDGAAEVACAPVPADFDILPRMTLSNASSRNVLWALHVCRVPASRRFGEEEEEDDEKTSDSNSGDVGGRIRRAASDPVAAAARLAVVAVVRVAPGSTVAHTVAPTWRPGSEDDDVTQTVVSAHPMESFEEFMMFVSTPIGVTCGEWGVATVSTLPPLPWLSRGAATALVSHGNASGGCCGWSDPIAITAAMSAGITAGPLPPLPLSGATSVVAIPLAGARSSVEHAVWCMSHRVSVCWRSAGCRAFVPSVAVGAPCSPAVDVVNATNGAVVVVGAFGSTVVVPPLSVRSVHPSFRSRSELLLGAPASAKLSSVAFVEVSVSGGARHAPTRTVEVPLAAPLATLPASANGGFVMLTAELAARVSPLTVAFGRTQNGLGGAGGEASACRPFFWRVQLVPLVPWVAATPQRFRVPVSFVSRVAVGLATSVGLSPAKPPRASPAGSFALGGMTPPQLSLGSTTGWQVVGDRVTFRLSAAIQDVSVVLFALPGAVSEQQHKHDHNTAASASAAAASASSGSFDGARAHTHNGRRRVGHHGGGGIGGSHPLLRFAIREISVRVRRTPATASAASSPASQVSLIEAQIAGCSVQDWSTSPSQNEGSPSSADAAFATRGGSEAFWDPLPWPARAERGSPSFGGATPSDSLLDPSLAVQTHATRHSDNAVSGGGSHHRRGYIVRPITTTVFVTDFGIESSAAAAAADGTTGSSVVIRAGSARFACSEIDASLSDRLISALVGIARREPFGPPLLLARAARGAALEGGNAGGNDHLEGHLALARDLAGGMSEVRAACVAAAAAAAGSGLPSPLITKVVPSPALVLCVDQLSLGELRLVLTYDRNAASGDDDGGDRDPLRSFLLTWLVGSVSRARIDLPPFVRSCFQVVPSALATDIAAVYLKAIRTQWSSILGSCTGLGSPLTAMGDVVAGLVAIHTDGPSVGIPQVLRGAIAAPLTLVSGFAVAAQRWFMGGGNNNSNNSSNSPARGHSGMSEGSGSLGDDASATPGSAAAFVRAVEAAKLSSSSGGGGSGGGSTFVPTPPCTGVPHAWICTNAAVTEGLVAEGASVSLVLQYYGAASAVRVASWAEFDQCLETTKGVDTTVPPRMSVSPVELRVLRLRLLFLPALVSRVARVAEAVADTAAQQAAVLAAAAARAPTAVSLSDAALLEAVAACGALDGVAHFAGYQTARVALVSRIHSAVLRASLPTPGGNLPWLRPHAAALTRHYLALRAEVEKEHRRLERR